MLEIADQPRGDFMRAQSEYEQAIRMLAMNQPYRGDYAAVLDNLARLYLDLGNAEISLSMEKKVLAVYGALRDHAAMHVRMPRLRTWN